MSDGDSARIDELERRVTQLEDELARVRAAAEASSPPVAAGGWAPPTAPTWATPAWQPAPQAAPQPGQPTRSFELDSEVVLKWGGVGLVVLAVAFAVSTAISRGWIGPELQLAGALAFSAGLVVAGLRLRERRPGWTHALCSAGVAAAFTTVASDLFLDHAPDALAYSATAAFALGGLVLARSITSEWVAAVALVGATIGWFVIGDGEPPVIVSTAFVVGIVGLAIAAALDRTWFATRLGAEVLGLVALAPLAERADGAPQRVALLVAAALLAAALARIPSVGPLTDVWQQLEVQLSIVGAPWAITVVALTFDLDDEVPFGVTALAVAALWTAVAGGLRRWLDPAHAVSLLIGASVALSIGLAALCSTTVAFVALAVQCAGLVQLSRLLRGEIRVLVNAAVLGCIATLFALVRMVQAWDDDAPFADDVAHLAIIAAITVAAFWTRRREVHAAVAVVVLALVLVWLGSVLVHLPQGQAAVSVAWAAVGTAVLVAGVMRRMTMVAAAGLTVLGLTVVKLLTVDLREVDTLWRAALFLLVGLGFLRLGFLLPRLAERDAPADSAADSARVEDEVERR